MQAWPSGGWYPQLVDYGHENGKAIRGIVGLINSNRPDLTWDHSWEVKYLAGFVEHAAWEDSKDIPPGVNAEIVVDPAFDAKAALGLDSGLIRSGSVGITGDFVKSHPDMDDYGFMIKQGKKVKGEVVRWLPKKITAVRHMAMIPSGSGADKNAGAREIPNLEHSIIPGGRGMEKEILDLLNEALGLLKLDPIIDNTQVPEGLAEKIRERTAALNQASEVLTGQQEKLQFVAAKHLLNEGETGLTTEEILERLPKRLEHAALGDAYIEDLRQQTLCKFDAAKANPEKPEMSEGDKKLRAMIEACGDPEMLKVHKTHFEELAAAKFSLNRSTAPPVLPGTGNAQTTNQRIARDADIADGVGSMFRRIGRASR